MKVFLIDPPHKIWSEMRGWVPAPALTALGAYLEKDFDIRILDCSVMEDPWRDLEEALKRDKPEVVGITNIALTFYYDTLHAAKLIKLVSPATKVVVGGPDPSLIPEEFLQDAKGDIDFIVVGEGELTLHELLHAIEEKKEDFSKIKGLAYLEHGKYVYTGNRSFIKDLDTLPMPAYHLLPMENALYGIPAFMPPDTVTICTSRGCPYSCTFCSQTVMWRQTWRGRSARKVADEGELLVTKYKKRGILIGDNDFLLNRERNIAFCNEIEKRKIKIDHIWIQANPAHIIRDRDLLPRYKRAGIFMTLLGTEAATQKIVDKYHKPMGVEQNIEAFKLLRANKILVLASMMIGGEYETIETIDEMARLGRKYGDFPTWAHATPFPGTAYYEDCRKKGLIEETDYRKYDWAHAVGPSRTLSREELEKLRIGLFQRVYGFRLFLKAFFYPNRDVRRYQRFAANEWLARQIFKRPWVAPNYQDFEDYIKERENPKTKTNSARKKRGCERVERSQR
jgi:anaerobic magnesium-protoporphyrin IX monomethyl ester cyclase